MFDSPCPGPQLPTQLQLQLIDVNFHTAGEFSLAWGALVNVTVLFACGNPGAPDGITAPRFHLSPNFVS